MHRPQPQSKAARPCNPPRALTKQNEITLELPAEIRRGLASCAAPVGVSRENYILAALLSRIRCDVDYIQDDAMAGFPGIEEGAL